MTYYIAREPSQARRIASSLAWVGTAQLAAVFVIQAAALAAVAHSEPQRVQLAAAISLLLPPGILALSFGLAILQGQRRFTAYNTLRIAPSIAYVVGVAVVYVSNATSLVLFMALWAAVNLVGGLIALVFSVRGLPKDAEEDATPSRWQMLRFGFKAFLGSLSPVDVVRLDQAVVGLFLAPVTLGFYVVAQALANVTRGLATSIGFVAYPQVAAEHDRASARRAMWRFFFLGLGLSALVVGLLELVAGQVITFFFGHEFAEATAIAQILLLASLFMSGRRVLTDGINGIGHPGFGTIAEVTSWVLLIPGLAILLPWLGAEGVAWALAISWGASLVVLIALALVADRTPASSRGRPAWTQRRLVAQVIGLAGAVILSVLVGLTAVFLPEVAFGLLIALSAALLFAFGRRTLAERARALRRRVARPDASGLDEATDDGFAVPRRLYYGGVLLLGLLTLRAGGQVTFSDVLFLASFLLACAEFVILRRRVPIRLPFLLLIGIAIFSLGGFLSTFGSYATTSSIAVIARLVFLTVFWFWLGTVVLRTQAHITRAMGFWVTSAAICGAGAVLQLLVGDVIANASIDGGRATGFTSQPNELGGLTAITFVPALMLASRARASVVTRAWSYASLLLVVAGLILSGSVSALIAAASAAVVWLALQRTSVHALLALATLAACVIALTALQSIRGAPHPLDRLESVTSSTPLPGGGTSQGSVEQRIDTYRVAIARIEEDPFVGVGLDLKSVTRPFGIESYEYDVHNLIVGVWYKAGLIGLVGMLIALLAILRSGWTAILGSSSTSESRVAVALASSFLAFLVFAMGQTILFSRYGWISAALILALRGVQQEREAVEPAARPKDAHRPPAAALQS
jgi:O-antigen/teichoic acid export membrane protein/O-antigen ligase